MSLLNIEQAAAYLNVPKTWVRDKVTAGEIPHTRIGKHVRFTEEHLKRIIKQGEPQRARRGGI
jgi:excisionase family DNA binding protein